MASLALSRLTRLAGLIAVGLLMYPPGATALQFRLLHSFGAETAGERNKTPTIPGGFWPRGELAIDRTGNLYGTTGNGGTHNLGVVFRISPAGKPTVLHSFSGPDGSYPGSGVAIDTEGNVYGAARGGRGYEGLVFKISQDGHFTILHNFTGGLDGARPSARPVVDDDGNLYGVTSSGGGGCSWPQGCGTVFRIGSDGKETIMHAFHGEDGAFPSAPLMLASDGSFYGSTDGGGANSDGTVFRLTMDGAESVIHSFTEDEGEEPDTALVSDTSGNLYGTLDGVHGENSGVAFKLHGKNNLKVLHGFGNEAMPSELVMDDAGNFLGTTYGDGNLLSCMGCGTVFMVKSNGDEEVLYTFGGAEGSHPTSGLTPDGNGNYFGVTLEGGKFDAGTVYEITP